MTRLRIPLLLCFALLTPLAAQPGADPVDWQPDLTYARPDGVDLKLDLARPAMSNAPLPLVICIHGGAWRSGSKAAYAPLLRMLAARGYATAAINYRLAPEHRFPAPLEDIAAALSYLASRAGELGIETGKVALLGDSAGGHLALLAGFRAREARLPVEIRAVVNVFGVSDLTSWKLATEGAKIEGLTGNEILEVAFGTSDRTSGVLKDASPVRWIRPDCPGVLTLHGDADPVVALSQARDLHRKLEDAGAPGRLEIIAGAGHNFTGADLQRAFAFTVDHLDRHLRGTRPPSFERIDAHAHVAPPPPAFLAMLDRQKVRLLNVTLVDPLAPGFDKPEPQSTWAAGIARQSGGRIGWAAPADPSGFEAPDWAARETRRLSADIDRGAAAIKLYKSLGLYLKSSKGRYVLPDDPAFAPVLQSLARKNTTLLTHLAEPRSSWQPLDPADPHHDYYRLNPDWHMHRHPERPSWEAIIAARDRMLGAHPALRVIGCHMGSMEHDLDAVAARLEKYPNFAVDTAARMPNLMLQPREKVRAFLLRFQDRVLWGTDIMELKWENPAEAIRSWEAACERDWRYFATSDTLRVAGRAVQGLALPDGVLRKIFRENALRWIPGLAKAPDAPLPPADAILSRYLQAAGGEDALRKITTIAAEGTIFVATYGAYGQFREYAKAPDRFVREMRFPGRATVQRAFDGKRAWEESPEYGVELLSGERLSQVRRQAGMHPALTLRSMYTKISVKDRERLDEFDTIVLRGLTSDGEEDLLWFDEASGLLLGHESRETFANGVSQRVRYLYEDYKKLNGVQVPHRIRYESPRLIWVVTRRVAHNAPVEDSVFLPPDERK